MLIHIPPSRIPYCAVSVVIPLYNAEKYIAEGLESLLNQTFQYFEVIVVDDCSTDSSCEVVEIYIPKFFGGRLRLLHMPANSGSAPARNKGFLVSRGEYIFFMDADDVITETALEEMYTLAKDYSADVVYCEKFYKLSFSEEHVSVVNWQTGNLVDKPTFESENLAERVQAVLNMRYNIMPWCKLVRRNLMIEHNIYFPACKISDDDIWTFGLVFYAKKFLRVPNFCYIYRLRKESVLHKKKTPEQSISFWMNPIIFGLKNLDNFMSKLGFFKQNPQYRYAVLENFLSTRIFFTREDIRDIRDIPPFEIYETIKNEFGKELGKQDVLVATLFARLYSL